MMLQNPPRTIRLTAFGIVIYVFLSTLASAMVLGPPISFFIEDRDEQTLLERGILAHFDLTASRPTHSGNGQVVDYVFQREAVRGISGRESNRSIVNDEDFAMFADPAKRSVLYDPDNPKNAAPVTSRSSFAKKHGLKRKFAIWFCTSSAAIILIFSTVGVRALRRKLRLLRFGVATTPTITKFAKSCLGRLDVEFQFIDADGKLWKGRQFFSFRIGIGGAFAPFMKEAIVVFDRDNPPVCELVLPLVSTFRFV